MTITLLALLLIGWGLVWICPDCYLAIWTTLSVFAMTYVAGSAYARMFNEDFSQPRPSARSNAVKPGRRERRDDS